MADILGALLTLAVAEGGSAILLANYFEVFRANNHTNKNVVVRLKTMEFYPSLLGTSMELVKTVEGVAGMQGTLADAQAVLNGQKATSDFQAALTRKMNTSELAAVEVEQMEQVLKRAAEVFKARSEVESSFKTAFKLGISAAKFLAAAALIAFGVWALSQLPTFGQQDQQGSLLVLQGAGLLGSLYCAAIGAAAGNNALKARMTFVRLAAEEDVVVPASMFDVRYLGALVGKRPEQ